MPHDAADLGGSRGDSTIVCTNAMLDEPKQPSFEQGLGRLERIVQRLEDGELSLEESLKLFEEGVQLSQSCRKQLRDAEAKVEILLKKEGGTEAQPFEPQDDGD